MHFAIISQSGTSKKSQCRERKKECDPIDDSVPEPETEAERAEYARLHYWDSDGFNDLCETFSSESGSFQWGCFLPQIFKLLLWFPDTGELVCSERMDCYAFESIFVVRYADGRLNAAKKLDIPGKVPGFLARVAVTLLLEGWLAIIFGYWKGLRYVVAANAVTQLALNAGLAVCIHYMGGNWLLFYLAYLLMEFFAFLVEWCGVITAISCPRRTRSICTSAASLRMSFWSTACPSSAGSG